MTTVAMEYGWKEEETDRSGSPPCSSCQSRIDGGAEKTKNGSVPQNETIWLSSQFSMKNLLPLLIISTVLSACITSETTPTPPAALGSDRDVHGCIASAGYSWCEVKTKCLRPWEEECFGSPYEAILWELSRKYAGKEKTITITMVSQTEKHARASVSFGGPGTPGGMVLASKMSGIWRIVYEGNGSVDCPALTKEEFPTEMLQGFCDASR